VTYAILRISAEAYADIRGRLLALDEELNPTPSYASEYIEEGPWAGAAERLRFGPVAFEALPEKTSADAGAIDELRGRLGELVLSVGALAKAMPDSVILEHEGLVNRVTVAAERLSHAEIEVILGGEAGTGA
jgi:hypothetical protein